jgi:putative transposase
MKNAKSLYHGHRFPAAVISRAVRWHFRFQFSLREIEKLLFERGVIVSYETVRRWCDKFGACFARRVKAARRRHARLLDDDPHAVGQIEWHLRELLVKHTGRV